MNAEATKVSVVLMEKYGASLGLSYIAFADGFADLARESVQGTKKEWEIMFMLVWGGETGPR